MKEEQGCWNPENKSAEHLDHTELRQVAKVLVFILRKPRKGESSKDFKHRTEIFLKYHCGFIVESDFWWVKGDRGDQLG